MHAKSKMNRLTDDLERGAKQGDESKRSSEEQYDYVPLGFCTLDREGVIREANVTLALMLKRDRQTLLEGPLVNFVSEDHRGFFSGFLSELFQKRDTRECELPLDTEDETVIWAHVRASVDDEGKRCRMIFTDITWRKGRDEGQPKQADSREQLPRGVQKLAGGIAHDFNNALTGVLGHAELAFFELPDDSPIRERMERIRQAAEYMASQSRKLLSYAGRSVLQLRRSDFSQMVEEAVEAARLTIPGNITLNAELERGLPPVRGDAAQIHQVVAALIDNAVEAYGQAEGEVKVRTGVIHLQEGAGEAEELGECGPGTHVFLEVIDDGDGMDDEVIGKIFEPFFSTKFAGRGLGLAAVMGAVRAHEGVIHVKSKPGRGSRFRVLIPAAEDRQAQPRPGDDWMGQGTVLFADDEDPIREVGRDYLKRVGFSVLTAADGIEAVKLVKQRSGELTFAILDLNMPRMDGIRTLAEIRRIRADIPVIITSGHPEEEIAGRLGEQSVAGTIQKPYNYEDFIAVIRKIFEN